MAKKAEYLFLEKIKQIVEASRAINKYVHYARPGEKKINIFPSSVIWWETTFILDDDDPSQSGLTVNQVLFTKASPQYGIMSYGSSEEEAVDAFQEIKDLVVGLITEDIPNRTITYPTYETVADVPMKEGNFFIVIGFIGLIWEYGRPIIEV